MWWRTWSFFYMLYKGGGWGRRWTGFSCFSCCSCCSCFSCCFIMEYVVGRKEVRKGFYLQVGDGIF